MSRYLLFAGADYNRGGGAHDFIDGFDDLESAIAAGQEQTTPEYRRPRDWWNVLDSVEHRLAAAGRNDLPATRRRR